MRLKQLKLAGFKSFANPTTFHFPKTITAIVGPNGCGKSNVIDAIRWVLGESSAKQLRGGAMSDVIFAGTQDKFAKSLASVELVFEHTQGDTDGKGGIHHALNLYHELSVRRQINRDGKSDYFVNGTKVRRRDVVDIFLGTGLGARSYAVIEQGMIGRIIDANAVQLREFIEEASGVSRYQSRREDTQKQLDTASDNLARLQDMVSELTAQQHRLAKQAKTAQLAQSWQHQLKSISQQLLIDNYGQAWQQQQHLVTDLQSITEQVAAQQQTIEQQTKQNQLIQRQISEQQSALQAQQNLAQHHWQQHHEAQTRLVQSQQNLASDQQRYDTLNFELTRFYDYEQTLLEQKQQAQTRIAQLPKQLEQLNKQLSEQQHKHHAANQQREQLAKLVVELQKQKANIEKQLAVSENAIQHHHSQQHRQQQRQLQYQQALATWQMAKDKFEREFAAFDTRDFDEKINKINEQIEQLENRIIARQEDLADQADEVASLTRQQRQAEQQRHNWHTEQTTLQNLLDNQQTTLTKTTKNLGQSDLPKLINQLQLTQQGKQFAPLFDTLASVFMNWAIASHGQLENIITERFIFVQNEIKNNIEKIDGLINLSELITHPKLPIFQQVWVKIESVEFANFDIQKSLENLPDNHWLLLPTLANEVVLINTELMVNLSNTLKNSGEKNQKNSPYFSQQFIHQARIDTLTELLTKQKPQLDRLATALQEANISLQEWQAQDRTARNELLALNQQQQTLQNDKLQQQLRYQAGFDNLAQEKRRLEQDRQRLAEENNGFEDLLANEQANLDSLRQVLTGLQPKLQQHISDRHRLDDKLNKLTVLQRELEQQQNRITQNLATGQLQITASNQQLDKAQQDKTRLQTDHQQLNQKIAEQNERLPKLQQQVTEQAEQLQITNQTLEQLGEQLTALQVELQTAQTPLQQAQQQFTNLQQQRHTTDTALALAKQTVGLIHDQLVAQDIALPAVTTLQLLDPHERKQYQHQTDTLKNQINQLGAVNYSAVAELAEVNSRLAPLTEQINDLTASIDKLQQAIKQIDSQTKQLFMDMLEQVNRELNKLFGQVFGGGQAQLILTNSDKNSSLADWQAGLELMAQPKGKKNSRLALLSGGEKTLTALSLIFAIFKQQPAPFCVLDEVDAPLDDANVARFTHLIHELAKEVQFIFISHNKLAMQIADELKGVTMPTAGVSKLVSVDMAEVEDYLTIT